MVCGLVESYARLMFYTLHLGACYSKWMAGMFQT